MSIISRTKLRATIWSEDADTILTDPLEALRQRRIEPGDYEPYSVITGTGTVYVFEFPHECDCEHCDRMETRDELVTDCGQLESLKRRYDCEPSHSYDVFFARIVRQKPAELEITV